MVLQTSVQNTVFLRPVWTTLRNEGLRYIVNIPREYTACEKCVIVDTGICNIGYCVLILLSYDRFS